MLQLKPKEAEWHCWCCKVYASKYENCPKNAKVFLGRICILDMVGTGALFQVPIWQPVPRPGSTWRNPSQSQLFQLILEEEEDEEEDDEAGPGFPHFICCCFCCCWWWGWVSFFLFFFALKEDQYLLSPIPVSSDEVAEVLQYWAS